ncbi:MAG: hypothetical protein ACXW3Z_14990 [Limisphaerales bacterium]
MIALLFATGVSLADGVHTGQISKSKGSNNLQIEEIEFIHRSDADARFLDLKTQWQNRHHGEIDSAVAAELAVRADQQSNVETPMEVWRYHGGPSPDIMRVRVHLYNNSSQARLNSKLTTRVRARVGQLLVHPRTLITDMNHLRQSATWMTLQSDVRTVPVLAPGEDKLEVVYTFNLPAFLNAHPSQWPVELEVSTSLSGSPARKTATLQLTPDHFTLHKAF